MALFEASGRARIEAAVHALEQRTAGEIVVVAVPRSDDYHELRLLYGVACALAAAAAAHLLWPALAVSTLFWLQVVVAVLAWALFGWGPLLRRLVPGSRLQAAVERRAREEFLEHGVFATRDRSGVLILLSELERRVVLLGDAGVHARVQTSGWQEHVQHIVTAIRDGRAAEGVCEVIAALAEVLAAEFPRRADDQDELSNVVRQEER